jgi:ubiquinone/menaquinone biosynthesis C-methylase UbiE
MNKEIMLNIGCGTNILKGYINIDIVDGDGVDLVLDFNKDKLPFNDNSVSKILCFHVLEHLINPLDLVMECHRVLKSGGRFYVKLPNSVTSLNHLRNYHGKDYFRSVCYDGRDNKSLQTGNFFKLLDQKGHLNFSGVYYRLRDFFGSLFFNEYEYLMEKV